MKQRIVIAALVVALLGLVPSGLVSAGGSGSVKGKASSTKVEQGMATPVQARRIAILDLTKRNGEGIGSTKGLLTALEVVGIPFVVTEDVAAATGNAVVVTSSYIATGTLKAAERQTLTNYVVSGGILVSSGVSDIAFLDLFGVSEPVKASTRFTLHWNVHGNFAELKYFDDPNEETISLGNRDQGKAYATRGYGVTSGTPLAVFDDSTAAVVKKRSGRGAAYLVGYSYTDLIVQNLLNNDFSAERMASNGFEPTTDTVILFLRAVFEANVAFPVWKHTSPGDSAAALVITHDADSASSMEVMPRFADLEAEFGVSSTYNITTHYIHDVQDNDYFTPYLDKVRYLLLKGQTLGSHSVGHFPDFMKESVFPMGSPGNTVANYQPGYRKGVTSGGTVYGELEVSKDLLDEYFGYRTRIFRSGYLFFNDFQVEVMEQLGYDYDSSVSANEVLTNFPYRQSLAPKSSSPVSRVYEIPMTISDTGLTADNYQAIVENWLDVLQRNTANGAVTTLLIHPNRDYKVAAERELLSRLPTNVRVVDMESFGDFWRAREAVDFDSSVSDGRLEITLTTAGPPPAGTSLYIGEGARLSRITVKDAARNKLRGTVVPVPGTRDVLVVL